jgi:hypothetical protein
MSKATVNRGTFGVVCCIVEQPDAKVRLVFDDASSPTSNFPQTWQAETLFTWKDYPEESFLQIDLSEEELAEIGMNLVARLCALRAQRKRAAQRRSGA